MKYLQANKDNSDQLSYQSSWQYREKLKSQLYQQSSKQLSNQLYRQSSKPLTGPLREQMYCVLSVGIVGLFVIKTNEILTS